METVYSYLMIPGRDEFYVLKCGKVLFLVSQKLDDLPIEEFAAKLCLRLNLGREVENSRENDNT